MKRLQRASPNLWTQRLLDVLPYFVTFNPACVSPDDTGSTLVDTIDLQLAKFSDPKERNMDRSEVSL
jgi:hypothetical protein